MDEFLMETEGLIEFISKSPTSFHVVKNITDILDDNKSVRLYENKKWKLEKGKSYYVVRNDSAVIAFKIPGGAAENFQIVASHSDSPALKIKENPEMVKNETYVEINVEKYGGALLHPWFDRPLSIAGRVVINHKDKIETKLIDFGRNICTIPSLAIHLNREANDSSKIDIQKSMMPILGDGRNKDFIMKNVAAILNVSEDEILGCDLFVVNNERGTIWGASSEFFSAPRIDDLMCVYSSVNAFARTSVEDKNASINVLAVFDNEEVGSATKQGADSSFLPDVLERIAEVLGMTKEEYKMMISDSFMISADNGHAIHPNYMDKSDPTNQPVMNGGVLIKFNASQKYTTDAVSSSVVKKLCKDNSIPYQTYVNNSNIPGGSTLGNIANTHVSMNTADIGAAQLAMHSPYESAGIKDTLYLRQFMEAFYSKKVSF